MQKKVILGIVLLQMAGAISAHVQVIEIPPYAFTRSLADFPKIQEDLDRLISGKLDHIGYMTSQEARQYLSSYVQQKYGKQAAQIISTYFNDNCFGLSKPQQLKPEQLLACDPYAPRGIDSALSEYEPKRAEELLQQSMSRWTPETRFLTPEQAYAGFILLANPVASLPACRTLAAIEPKVRRKAQELKDKGLYTLAQYKKEYPEKADAIFSYKYFGVPQEAEERKKYFLQKDQLAFLNKNLIQNIYNVAKRIIQVTKPGDYIVIFGNTPYFVGRTLQKLAGDSRKIIIFPFSGAPNRVRSGSFFKPEDIVTQERWAHLIRRLNKAGIGALNSDLNKHAIYFVDVIGSGAGVAYTIEVILRSLMAKEPLPNFNVIALNNININDPEDRRNAQIAKQSAGDGEYLTFYFPNKDNPHFTIDGQVIFLPNHGVLDNLRYASERMLPEYNAAYWVDRYDYLLNQPHTPVQEALLGYFDTNLDELIKQDKTK